MIPWQKQQLARVRRLVSVVVLVAFIILALQADWIPSRLALSTGLPSFTTSNEQERRSTSNGRSYSSMIKEVSPTSDLETPTGQESVPNVVQVNTVNENDGKMRDSFIANPTSADVIEHELEDEHGDVNDSVDDDSLRSKVSYPVVNSTEGVESPQNLQSVSGHATELSQPFMYEQSTMSENYYDAYQFASTPTTSITHKNALAVPNTSSINKVYEYTPMSNSNPSIKQQHYSTVSLHNNDVLFPQRSDETSPSKISMTHKNPNQKTSKKRKRSRQILPSVSISEMEQLLLQNRASYRSPKPRWSTLHDDNILSAKAKIENAPDMKDDHDGLYGPAFRNISMFKRSYDLMEQMLKVYIYKEGEKPIFHQPVLEGIYASEGWFLKLMEQNADFVVTDPSKANMFYLPFSSIRLRSTLYGHTKRTLALRLKGYIDMIASKYPFWNRTGGADHFLAACHDWAPYETSYSAENTIRALCNANLQRGFRLGKDVSLPTTAITSSADTLMDLGGHPADQRPILAFFAGNMHGKVRPVLLQHWENKDPDMKIFGPMPRGRESRMTYTQYMKTSKYCICPKGYEVHSPRVVEAIFYECVPVIISDNYVLPFFEVLNWEAFSVTIAEADIPRLKEILFSIPKEKYSSLQLGVRNVQQHFLWHNKPVKYDAFLMILHSIWYNRVFTAITR